jgi:hypothetical protein
MPAFNAKPAIGLYPGDSVVLVNDASTDTGISYTQQVAVIEASQFTLQNTSNHDAVVYVAAQDYPAATANYSPLTDADTGVAITCVAGTSINFTTRGPFICAHFASSPTSGSLILAR